MIKKFLFCLLCTWLLISNGYARKIKVACVGNSITYGAFIPNRNLNSYPAQLGAYLGDSYEVKNFGISATTLLSRGNYPYITTDAYKQSLAYEPDIVFIKLGTNDSKGENRIYLKDDFKKDYLQLIDSYQKLSSHPRIILLTPIRCFLPEGEGISNHVIQHEIMPIIHEIAYKKNIEIINLYNIFGDKWSSEWMPDQLHPSSIGAGRMAANLYGYLTVNKQKSEKDVISSFSLKPIKEFNFYGYKGFIFNNKGVEYYIVRPHQVAKGNPWIWRARFWGHEAQTDLSLLERGFYLTYCDVADMYGSPAAVNRWNQFYKLATKAGLNKKVALECMSRGGLIAYNWAVKNLNKVACIYADAPVMDFKSWPMGKGDSKQSEHEVKQLLTAYNFSSIDEALTWQRNPIDHVSKLAKASIPMLHVVGDDDHIVPIKENTTVFAKKLAQKGHKLEIIHKPGVGHHPHSLNNPEKIVNFILRNTNQGENMCAHPVPGNEYRSGAGWIEGSDWHAVANDITATLKGRHIKLLMVGNSITQGLGGNRKLVTCKPGKEIMDEAFGKGEWETAGISGDRTQNVLWRLQHGNYAISHPKIAIVTIGINNVIPGDDPAEIAEGIYACALEAKKQLPGTRIITFGLLPSGKEKDCRVRKACNLIHEILAKKKWKGIEYVNPTSHFINQDGSLRTELYNGDFLHLNSEGYKAWTKVIKQILL